ncbi:DUF4199 domain-containing protein [Chryseolinea sp. H1M3-3]|uniref:DUF4199 domain-containing protein n=1 Tax=Chryseolinea sp. H1M3-3 TaxID=3034144 RepID=UPI0023EDF025|nr:DUF4199 domain-containing protein [Chryseolinea sp. H1M3-3]
MEQNVTAPAITTRSTGIRYGVINGVIGIAYFLILTMADIDMSKGFGRWGGTIITIVIVFLAHKYFKENGDGYMSFGQGVGIGFWTGLVSAVISSLFTYIYAKFIDPSFISTIREKAIEDMEAKGQSQEQIDAAMKFVEMFTSAEAILVMGVIFGVLIVVIVALIISIFTQKPHPETSI